MVVKAIDPDRYTTGIITKQIGIGYLKMATRKKKEVIVPDDMENQEIIFRMRKLKERPDGGADMELDMNDYTKSKLIEIGVVSLLKEHIAQQQPKKKWWQIWK